MTKKKIVGIILLTAMLSVLFVSQAMAELMLCERPCSDQKTEHYLDGWRQICTTQMTCSTHANCVVRYVEYGRNYRCSVCGYHYSVPEQRKTVETHDQALRTVPEIYEAI